MLGFKLSVDYHQCPAGCSHDGGDWRRTLHPGLLRAGWEFGPSVLKRTSAPFSQKMKHTLFLVPCQIFAPALLRGFPWTTRKPPKQGWSKNLAWDKEDFCSSPA